MRFVLVSNYINHHQIPLCREIMNIIGEDSFTFLQTQPMEEERLAMGWGGGTDGLSFVMEYEKDKEAAIRLIAECDVVLLGWTLSTEVIEACLARISAGKVLIRMSERIYREGRYRAISPRGLLAKYHEHIKYRKDNVYMLCSGAYTGGDFRLIQAYPGKLLKWGYFPELRDYGEVIPPGFKDRSKAITILWAGRFMRGVKHPEYALDLAVALRNEGIPFHLDMAGDGEMRQELEAFISDNNLDGNVTLCGFCPPPVIRDMMEKAEIYLFTSNHLEGWGAVVNEAMNSGCAVVAGSEAGCVPYLIRHGENGLIYKGDDEKAFIREALKVAGDRKLAAKLGEAAYQTVRCDWNPACAAERVVDLAGHLLRQEVFTPYLTGPLSPA